MVISDGNGNGVTSNQARDVNHCTININSTLESSMKWVKSYMNSIGVENENIAIE
ncbi:MAG: hypothetical protein MHPSP_003956, partial [Paramarteilia canceri]